MEELLEFKAYMEYKFKDKMSECVIASQTKAILLKQIIKELFLSTNLDNQDSTTTLEEISDIDI